MTNHLSSEKLREKMGTNYFAWHGFTEVKLGDRWVKASPTFNSTLCSRFGVAPLDFDGESDALLQAYDGAGRTFMRYEVLHGAFHDVPAKFLIARNGAALSEPEGSARPLGRRHGERGSARARLTAVAALHCGIRRSTNPAGLKRSRGSGVATFRAVRIDKSESGQTAKLVDFDETELMDGDVTVRVEWSTVNYKDGLAVSGKAPVVRRFPMIPGIDFVGMVETSTHPEWKPGDRVILNGWGVGETHLGAYAEKARVRGDWLVPVPTGMTGREAMAIGTAGYTAMLAVMALERHGITPDRGPVVVTGAAGGVGSVAIALLAKRGFKVIASTGRLQEEPYLRGLGASEILDRKELSAAGKPLAKERWVARHRTRSARRRSPTCLPARATAARSRPAALPAAWICRPPLRRSFCARCRFWASTA